jgi:SAM-dependent methyltransferase
MQPPIMTDRTALARNRARAAAMPQPAMFLQREAIAEVQERLTLVNRTFKSPAMVTPFAAEWQNTIPGATIVPDDDVLDLQPGAHDLVVHAMSLHWANDPVGQIVQARRALAPDGLFLAVLLGGQTLNELRSVLAEAEISVTGGLSPRIVPMAEIRDLGGLIQRAGLALPVADSITLNVEYQTMTALMLDLRAMGETNALTARNKRWLQRDVISQGEQVYRQTFPSPRGIRATFELIFLTGWAPHADQQQPLRPGSATARLADALHTDEIGADETTAPGRRGV